MRYLLSSAIVCFSLSGCQKESAAPVISSFFPESGIGGTRITIGGSNFSSSPTGNRVQFGGVDVEVISAAPTQLAVIAPAAFKTGKITITASGKTGSSQTDIVKNPEIITIAGLAPTYPPSFGFADGTGPEAKFQNPRGLALDASGSIIVADQDAFRIRKVTMGGVATTISGNGMAGYSDGPPSSAQYYTVMAVALDPAGNIYVGDGKVRKLSTAGIVGPFAGSTFPTGALINGVGPAAGFSSFLTAMTCDQSGNLYVVEPSYQVVRKITPGAAVTALAGGANAPAAGGYVDGPSTSAKFNFDFQTAGIGVDKNGNVYVSDQKNYAIRKITADGTVSTLAGGALGTSDGTGKAAQFTFPGPLAVDADGNIYVADETRIRKITPAGVVTTYAGVLKLNGLAYGQDGDATTLAFRVNGMAIDAAGILYFSDGASHQIRKIVP
jgi:hypothetical protein